MRPTIVNCSPFANSGWRWFEDHLDAEFQHVDLQPRNWLERRVRKPYLARYRAAAEAAHKSRHADLLVTHSPLMTAWTELFRDRRARHTPHLAFSFNFTTLPEGTRLRLMRSVLPRVDRFVCFSTMERRLYAETFGIDPRRIDMIYWGVRAPEVAMDAPAAVPGPYLCAVGGEGRDYPTFIAAMRALPDIQAVIVARPHNLAGLDIPRNVTVRTNIPSGEANAIIERSRFMVLPLLHSQVPCGHVTIVSAMYLGKALIVTASEGVADYVHHEQTGLLCLPGSVDALAAQIKKLWQDTSRSDALGRAGHAFARENCSEAATIAYVRSYLASIGLTSQT